MQRAELLASGRGAGADGPAPPGELPAGRPRHSSRPASQRANHPPPPSCRDGNGAPACGAGGRGDVTWSPRVPEATPWDQPSLTSAPRQHEPDGKPPAAGRSGRSRGTSGTNDYAAKKTRDK